MKTYNELRLKKIKFAARKLLQEASSDEKHPSSSGDIISEVCHKNYKLVDRDIVAAAYWWLVDIGQLVRVDSGVYKNT